MQTSILKTSFGNLAYYRHGIGPKVYLLFHGFAQSSKAFDAFLKLRQEDETYITVDVFYHGQSSWNSIHEKLTKEIWRSILLQLMAQETFEKFHLVGYSMGGKFCLVSYELFPNYVQSLLLMAPDGIKTGFWYNMATFPGMLNRLFRHVVFHPRRFFQTMDILHRLGLLESSFIKFVKSQMLTKTMRAQVYFTWSVFKPVQPNLTSIIQQLRLSKTPITLVTGTFDKMITSENLQKFSSKIPHIQKVELPSGHTSLIDDYTEKTLIA
jgi:pimeloyl-ACP methyl ester carboxylesterase